MFSDWITGWIEGSVSKGMAKEEWEVGGKGSSIGDSMGRCDFGEVEDP